MKFLALIHSDADAWEATPEAEKAAVYARYRSFLEEGRAAGIVLGGDELRPPTDATTVRVRGGETLVTDGPYAEVKEALGGYFLLDCADAEEACTWAARIPAAQHGAVEVRAVHVDESGGAS
ncbi:MAG: YciI family protein [Gaiella sp.]